VNTLVKRFIYRRIRVKR